MNRIAVAMAADSLISIDRVEAGETRKTLSTKSHDRARKLVQLHARDPIGVMFYDSPDFHGLPWEVILGEFARTQDVSYDRVEDYASAFFGFLGTQSKWVSAEQIKRGIEG